MAALLAISLPATAEQWIRSGPGPDAYVRGVRLFANTPVAGQSVLFAATLGAGVLKVTDNGSSVTTIQINNGLPVRRIRTISATDVNTLFAALEVWGVYKSTDGGANWSSANGSGGTALGCRALRNISVRSATEIWALGACRHNSGIYRSLDGGTSWSRLGTGVLPDDVAVGSIAFSGSGGTTVAVASTGRDGIFRSNDNGTTWTQINNGLPAPAGANRLSVFNVQFLANNQQMLAYVEGHGIYRSLDSGANWAAFGAGLPANYASISGLGRESSTVFYVGVDKGAIYRSTNGGANWSAWGASGSTVQTLYARGVTNDATAAGRYWVHGAAGLARTNDSGTTFSEILIPEGNITSGLLEANGTTGYVVARDIFKINDIYNPDWSAATTISSSLPASVDSIALDVTQPGTRYAVVTNRGVYKTTNDGASWTQLPLPNHDIGSNPVVELAPSNTQIVYAGLDNKYDVAAGAGFKKSVNGGASWSDASVGLSTPDSRSINSIAVTQDPNLLLITTGDGVYRSTNGGASWSLTLAANDAAGQPMPFSSIRFDPFNAAVAWATANHVDPDGTVRASSGVYKSINGGANWSQVLSAKRTTSIRPEGNGRVTVLLTRDPSQPAMLATKDGGISWQAFDNGITDKDGVGATRVPLALGNHIAMAFMASGTYVLEKPLLSVTINGSGTVASSPTGIACPGTCAARMYDNDQVNLAAVPVTGRYFSGWSGNCSGTGTCQLVMDAAKSVTATFLVARVTDLNADGKSDILYRNFNTGQLYRFTMNGFAFTGGGQLYTEPNTNWRVIADADFTGDGVTDLLWRNVATGQNYLMTLNASGAVTGGSHFYTEGNLNWRIVHTPDFDGDGKADFLWWNSASGQVFGMLWNGTAIGAQGLIHSEPNLNWRIVAVGDFAGSGKRNQLLWHNLATGHVYLMTVNVSGGVFSESGLQIYRDPNTAWKILGAPDFNGDGRSDILWRNESTGQVYIMLMNGSTIFNAAQVYQEGNSAWKIVATGDYNGDGKADLLWRNEATGHVFMMLMNGFTISSASMVYQEPNLSWRILGPWEYSQP